MMTGGCLCGQVRYEADGAPAWTAICYCRDCQRASGSGYMPVMGVPLRDADHRRDQHLRGDGGRRRTLDPPLLPHLRQPDLWGRRRPG